MPVFLRKFLYGASFLLQGLAWFRKKPGLMILGMIPPLIVSVGLIILIVFLSVGSAGVIAHLTAFADGWVEWLRTLFRLSLQIGFILALTTTSWMVFVGLSLMVGEPFYNKLWQSTEQIETGTIPSQEVGWVTAIGDAFNLIGKGILVGLLGLVIGLVPFIGSFLSLIVVTMLNGRVFAEEITSRGLIGRGKTDNDRENIWSGWRWEMLGFGVASQLSFLIPFGALFTMPSVIVGGTLLTQKMAD